MAAIGYTMMGEQRSPTEMVDDAVAAERAGFDFAVVSDHFHPWVEAQGHSPYTWSVLGAVAQATERIPFMTYVTCPTIRYHPAIVAQKAATVSLLSDERFILGLGAGEHLNEHVVGSAWPPANVRHEMLSEAVDIIRMLWDGGFVTHRGRHFTVQDAKLYDRPVMPPRIGLAASGHGSCELAGQKADMLIAVEPRSELVRMFAEAGGAGKPAVGQILVCWGPDEARCRALALEQAAWTPLDWKVRSELPNPVNFESASAYMTEDEVASVIPCGPSAEGIIEGVRGFVDAGFDQVAFVQLGGNQREFCEFYAAELASTLRDLSVA
jgi:G6PDH family F420-dependent oxidoreductase